MRKFFLIIGSLLILISIAIFMLWQNYISSPEYNYFTAKLDIKNGNTRFINIGGSIDPSTEKEIQVIASKYGFQNVYLKKATSKEMKGIKNYNETIGIYLNVRNGAGWRYNYQKEIDSI